MILTTRRIIIRTILGIVITAERTTTASESPIRFPVLGCSRLSVRGVLVTSPSRPAVQRFSFPVDR